MEALDKCVVEQEHDRGEPPRPLLAPEQHLPNITDILDFGMA